MCDQLPSANKNILLGDEKKKTVFTTPPIVLRTPACRRSEPALNQYSRRDVFLAKTRNWSRGAFLSELSPGPRVCTRLFRHWCECFDVVRTFYVSVVLSLLHTSHSQCHSFAGIGCVDGFEVERRLHCFSSAKIKSPILISRQAKCWNMSMDFRLYDDEAISIHMVKLFHGKFIHRLFYDRTPREL